MKPKYFFYSETQRDIALDMQPKKNINMVYVNGEFVPYTEMSSTNSSNFSDVKKLGAHPNWWIKINGRIQDEDLAEFISNQ